MLLVTMTLRVMLMVAMLLMTAKRTTTTLMTTATTMIEAEKDDANVFRHCKAARTGLACMQTHDALAHGRTNVHSLSLLLSVEAPHLGRHGVVGSQNGHLHKRSETTSFGVAYPPTTDEHK